MGFISKIIGDLPFPKIFKFEETRDPLKYDMLLAKNLNNPTSSLQANILFLRRMINNILQNMNVAWDDKWEEHDRIFKQHQEDMIARITQLHTWITEELKKLRGELKQLEDNLRAELKRVEGELKEELKQLRADLQKTRGELKQLENDLRAELKKLGDDLQKTKEDLKKTEESLRAELKKLSENLQKTKEDLRAELKKTEESLRAELKKTKEDLRAELKQTKEDLRAELKQTKEDLRAELKQTEESLRAELSKVKGALSKVAITVKTTKVTSNRICVLERVQANSVITIRGYIRSLTGNYSSQNLVITPYIKPLYASGSLDTREITSTSEGPIITYPCLSTVTYIQHSFVKDTGSENVMISFTSTSSLELNLEILWAQNTVIN